MFTLDLARLERVGFLEFEADIAPDDPLWNGSGLTFEGPLKVRGRASLAGSGEVLVDAVLDGVLAQECRRCLEPVRTPIHREPLLVFGSGGAEEDDGEIRALPEEALDLDLGEAIREELILEVDPFVLCDPECRGLCPRCGANLNETTCECEAEVDDPRWDALRALKTE